MGGCWAIFWLPRLTFATGAAFPANDCLGWIPLMALPAPTVCLPVERPRTLSLEGGVIVTLSSRSPTSPFGGKLTYSINWVCGRSPSGVLKYCAMNDARLNFAEPMLWTFPPVPTLRTLTVTSLSSHCRFLFP